MVSFNHSIFASVLMQQPDPRIELQRGIDLMEIRGDCKAAVDIFSKLTNTANRSVAARAFLYIGQCHQKLGKDPKAFYSRLIREFQDQQAVHLEAARSRGGAISADVPRSAPGSNDAGSHQPDSRRPGAL